MALVGRRPGRRDTRAEILAAARAAFVEEGYERPSLRGIARRAGVDPALIHHYFKGKADLFTEALKLGRDPREIVVELSQSGGERTGADLVRAFLGLWETGRPGEQGSPPFAATAQAVSSSPEAAAGLREYLEDRVWSLTGSHLPPGERELRRALVASQLMGLAWTRYLLRLEPLASAPPDEVARWIGPTLDRYMREPLPPPEDQSVR
jgi:AcrR family transcriptional regulator